MPTIIGAIFTAYLFPLTGDGMYYTFISSQMRLKIREQNLFHYRSDLESDDRFYNSSLLQ
jgi:hypothetical protein